MKLVLASASPRRRDLLESIGLGFDVKPRDLDEAAVAGTLPPLEAATAVAAAKARALPTVPGTVVLAADTIVVLDGETIGKPTDAADARRMLVKLRNRVHTVVTAVNVRAADTEWAAALESTVRMRDYGDHEVDAYVAVGGGLDKAGAYGIQDDGFLPVEAIEGCYCNVMGLPLWTAYRLLREAGCTAPRRPGDVLSRCAVCPMRP
jgi:nucleoside triphosphate pyrophosphatase